MDKCQYCVPITGERMSCRATTSRDNAAAQWHCTREHGHSGPHVACGGYRDHEMHKWSEAERVVG